MLQLLRLRRRVLLGLRLLLAQFLLGERRGLERARRRGLRVDVVPEGVFEVFLACGGFGFAEVEVHFLLWLWEVGMELCVCGCVFVVLGELLVGVRVKVRVR